MFGLAITRPHLRWRCLADQSSPERQAEYPRDGPSSGNSIRLRAETAARRLFSQVVRAYAELVHCGSGKC